MCTNRKLTGINLPTYFTKMFYFSNDNAKDIILGHFKGGKIRKTITMKRKTKTKRTKRIKHKKYIRKGKKC